MCPFLFLFLSVSIHFQMSFPRRSARLAAKAAKSGPILQIEEISAPTPSPSSPHECCRVPSNEDARRKFMDNKGKPVSDDEKRRCVTIIKQYLNDVDVARGRTAKAVLATRLACFLLENPCFMAAHERFYKTVVVKMEELKSEKPIEDAVIDLDFRTAVEDLLIVVKD